MRDRDFEEQCGELKFRWRGSLHVSERIPSHPMTRQLNAEITGKD